MKTLAKIDMTDNGWVVTLLDGTLSRTLVFTCWEDVEKAVRDTAFPYPDKTEPRKP